MDCTPCLRDVLLRSLLGVKDDVLGERWVCLQFVLVGNQILAFESQPRTSATTAGSCGMEKSSLTNNRGRQGRGEVRTAIELAGGPNQHVGRNPGAPERHIGGATATEFRRRVVRHDDHEVVVAVWTGVSPGDGTEEINMATLLFAPQPLAYARGSVRHRFGAANVRERMRNYL